MMKYLPFLLLFFLAVAAHAQSCPRYVSLMRIGNAFSSKKQYDSALNKFLAAQIAARECNVQSDSATQAIKQVYELIEQERNRAQTAERAAQIQKEKAEELNKKNDKLIDAFYFYNGNYAVADSNHLYGFINKDGNFQHKLTPHFIKAEPFDSTGFARVKKYENGVLTNYLVDTFGDPYKVAYKIEELKPGNNYTAIDLRDSKLDSFPTAILNYPNLLVLLANGYNDNDTVEIPASIAQLNQLKHLYWRRFNTKELPATISELSELISLDVNNNDLHSLPPDIGKLQNLQSLDVSENVNLAGLPSGVYQLTNLKSLAASDILLNHLPDSIGQLKYLNYLDLSNDSISKLPETIGNLIPLYRLNLLNNQLTTLPSTICDLKQLADLDIHKNYLTSLPDEFGNLRNLVSLDASQNNLRRLPPSIGKLSQLTELNLTDNQLTDLPESFSNLGSLRHLYLQGNHFAKRPRVIQSLNLYEVHW